MSRTELMEAFRQPHPDELDEKARHEQLFDVGYGWVVHCIRLSPPGAHEISVVYRPMRKVDDVGEEWKVGSVDEVHALMVELYAREFEDTVLDEQTARYTVTELEQLEYEIEVKAATDEMAALMGMDLVDAGAAETVIAGVRKRQIHVVKWRSEGSREHDYYVQGVNLPELREIVESQIGRYAAGTG